MSSVSGGLVAKRFKNAKRPPGGRVDPFWPSVMVLAPLSGSGQNILDIGPLENVFVPVGTGVFTYEQDNSNPLFGLNTLHVDRPAVSNPFDFQIQNLTDPITLTSDICVEYWFNQTVGTSSIFMPRQIEFRQQSAPGVFGGLLGVVGSSPSVPQMQFAVGSPSVIGLFTLGTWNYVCWQYVASLGRVYCTLNGVLRGSAARVFAAANGWRITLPTQASADVRYTCWVSQLRITKANRYGTQAAPIPSGPWPTS